MEFRPCIDIHNGKVKQIVGGTLKDEGNKARENFISEQDAAFYARLYQKDGLKGGHVILLNKEGTEYYEKSKRQALLALSAWPMGLQVGGGIREDNAEDFLRAGAEKVIVTSYVFREGNIEWERLEALTRRVGKEHLVLDVSCRKRDDAYYIVTDRWQRFTDVKVKEQTLLELSSYCSEFLVHAVDVEGKRQGIERPLVELLGNFEEIPVTYAGGVGSFEDLKNLKKWGKNRLHVTIGSALDLFGGEMNYREVVKFIAE
ncbi:MAG: phosphoribosylformimino-5-aminoimidazole carboxamide ribotide isomerase [Lachnospiraceae bacterium]|jgi:phosphoribosylformimino-5-aminoimidazole carboxamide ribotide isomerase|nr:phosphoribosylformimino-5-aminoimidazole carboxamide ribotide isomerase [Lachnospiraceae bacterium]